MFGRFVLGASSALAEKQQGPTAKAVNTIAGTQVEIIHHGFERLGTAASATLEAYEAGWDNKHIKALRALVET